MKQAAEEMIFTIGHSTHSQECFLALLIEHSVTAVCDVRSRPFSRMNPQFNRDVLSVALRQHQIQYVFLGEELGARTPDPGCYLDGRVQYDRLSLTPLFQQGMTRLREGMAKYRIAIMCAEKEPLDCHRTILVARHLAAEGIFVQHIHPDGSLESQEDAVLRMAQLVDVRVDEHNLFYSREEMLSDAYRLQGDRIAYEMEDQEPDRPPVNIRAAG